MNESSRLSSRSEAAVGRLRGRTVAIGTSLSPDSLQRRVTGTVRSLEARRSRLERGAGACSGGRGRGRRLLEWSARARSLLGSSLPVTLLRELDLPREVVAVLLRPEPAPLATTVPQVRIPGAEQALRAGIAVRDEHAGDLVVSLVLAEAAGRGIEGRRRVAALGEPANRLQGLRVVLRDVEDPPGVERIALAVQPIACVLDERDQVPREEGDVVEARDRRRLRLVEEGKLPFVGRRVFLDELEDRRPFAAA